MQSAFAFQMQPCFIDSSFADSSMFAISFNFVTIRFIFLFVCLVWRDGCGLNGIHHRIHCRTTRKEKWKLDAKLVASTHDLQCSLLLPFLSLSLAGSISHTHTAIFPCHVCISSTLLCLLRLMVPHLFYGVHAEESFKFEDACPFISTRGFYGIHSDELSLHFIFVAEETYTHCGYLVRFFFFYLVLLVRSAAVLCCKLS